MPRIYQMFDAPSYSWGVSQSGSFDAFDFTPAPGDAPEAYLEITLTDVIISSYQTGGASGGDQPTESLSLNFAKIEYAYADPTPDLGITEMF